MISHGFSYPQSPALEGIQFSLSLGSSKWHHCLLGVSGGLVTGPWKWWRKTCPPLAVDEAQGVVPRRDADPEVQSGASLLHPTAHRPHCHDCTSCRKRGSADEKATCAMLYIWKANLLNSCRVVCLMSFKFLRNIKEGTQGASHQWRSVFLFFQVCRTTWLRLVAF